MAGLNAGPRHGSDTSTDLGTYCCRVSFDHGSLQHVSVWLHRCQIDLQTIKAKLKELTDTVDAIEEAHLNASDGDNGDRDSREMHLSPAELQGKLLCELRDMKIAVEGPQGYLFTIRAEVSLFPALGTSSDGNVSL